MADAIFLADDPLVDDVNTEGNYRIIIDEVWESTEAVVKEGRTLEKGEPESPNMRAQSFSKKPLSTTFTKVEAGERVGEARERKRTGGSVRTQKRNSGEKCGEANEEGNRKERGEKQETEDIEHFKMTLAQR
ncbi:hypothetical protein CC78DRAFT_540151 [Lojkania enalia]|uniref:Uncharacterized protein n=1 Tax=Lojkania enalia TaxID=147567 RepID=A0A9P4N9I9_9PLEO|nr:hypothetical protein CC78DRAFT_540151 [Didymosphaeria enalia]